jgi:hypothetical protein
MNESYRYAFSIIDHYWSSCLYIKPTLCCCFLYCIISLIRIKKNLTLRRYCLIYLISALTLFISMDLVLFYRVLTYPDPKRYIYPTFAMENVNLVFQFIEIHVFFKIMYLDIKWKAIEWLRRAAMVIFLLIAVFYSYTIFHKTGFWEKRIEAEMATSVSFVLILVGFFLYYRKIASLNINSTFITPLIYMIFCYSCLSLLIFPCTAFFNYYHSTGGHYIYCYYYVVLAFLAIMMKYNVSNRDDIGISYITFDV